MMMINGRERKISETTRRVNYRLAPEGNKQLVEQFWQSQANAGVATVRKNVFQNENKKECEVQTKSVGKEKEVAEKETPL